MSKLFVITFKRPATNLESALYDVEFCYDCDAFVDEAEANTKLVEYKETYTDVNMFECEDYRYREFCKMTDAFVNFAKTGEHSMNELEEDVDVGTDAHTETIHLKLEMTRQLDDASFDYHVDIDDVGQIVFTPVDTNTSFTDVTRLAGYDLTEDIIEGNKRIFAITLTANMIAEDGNFDWFYDLDEVGQAVVTPDAESTSFLTVAVEDSLNLVTECNESLTLTEALDPSSKEYQDKRELCVEVMTDLDNMLEQVGKKFEALQRLLEEMGIDARDFEKILKAIAACHQGRDGDPSIADAMRRIEEYEASAQDATEDSVEESVQKVFNEEFVMEELEEEEKLKVIDRFMKGEVYIVQVDEVPVGETIVRLADLDSKDESGDAEFYYDTEKDVVVCHNKRAE